MPFKVPFRVINVSSQDENFKGSELNIHGPTTKGWQSSRYCVYPQDIIIQLEKRIHLKKIQILSHQYLIASKIEFYVGDVPDEVDVTLSNARYTRLGYVALSDNEKTMYKARELKSVHVDAVGHFIKLLIHKNHVNKQNKYNQVSLIAINVIGDEVLPDSSREDSNIEGTAARKLLPSERPDYISPLDDLAFDMYQDPEIAQILRKLERLKQQAVNDERYDYAKELKSTIQKLQKVGEKLGRYEVEKKQAVENEDYDRAKQKKSQMDDYRQKIYDHLHIGDLVELNTILPNPVMGFTHESEDANRSTLATPASDSKSQAPQLTSRTTPTRSSRCRSDSSPHPADTRGTPPPGVVASYDDRPLPAVRRVQESVPSTPWTPPGNRPVSHRFNSPSAGLSLAAAVADLSLNEISKNEHLMGEEVSNVSDTANVEPEPLSEMDQREAGGIIDTFGQNMASKLYSKHWSFREEAVTSVHDQLLAADISTSNKDDARSLMRAALLVFIKAIKDNVLSVFTSAINLHRMIVSQFVVKHKLPRSDVISFVERSLPNLLMKTADTSARQRDAAKALIIEESSFSEVKATHVLLHECVRPFKSSTAPRMALSRTELVESLFNQHGLSNGGLTVDNMMGFLTVALSHTAGEVRDCAEGIIVSLYKVAGSKVKGYLPPDDDQTRKNLLYKQLFKEFDKIDDQLKLQNQQKKLKQPKQQQKKLPQPSSQPSAKHPFEERELRQKGGGDVTGRLKVKPESNLSPRGRENEKVLHQDLTCIFCGEVNERFTDEGLDAHYWKNCPMLKKCQHCSQVVEISGLTEHLLTECEGGVEFVLCSRCSDAIPANSFKRHAADNNCPRSDPSRSRCPLCYTDLPPGEESWKKHLMGRDSCRMNPRRPTAAGPGRAAARNTAERGSPQQIRYTPNPSRGRQK